MNRIAWPSSLCSAFLLVSAATGCATGKRASGVGQDESPDGAPAPPVMGRADASPNAPDGALVVADPDAGVVHPPDPADAAPNCTVQLVNLLGNPGFDSGPGGGWNEQSSGGWNLVVNQSTLDGVSANSAPYVAWLGGDVSLDDSLTESVTIPDDATDVHVRGVRLVQTEEDPAAIPYDFGFLELVDGSGTQLEGLKEWSNQDDTSQWSAFNLPITGDYRGQTVKLRFRSSNDDSNISNFFFDSLALELNHCQ